jgi:hypothetical protein
MGTSPPMRPVVKPAPAPLQHHPRVTHVMSPLAVRLPLRCRGSPSTVDTLRATHDSKPVRRTVGVYTHRPDGARPPRGARVARAVRTGRAVGLLIPRRCSASRPRDGCRATCPDRAPLDDAASAPTPSPDGQRALPRLRREIATTACAARGYGSWVPWKPERIRADAAVPLDALCTQKGWGVGSLIPPTTAQDGWGLRNAQTTDFPVSSPPPTIS